MWGEGSFCLVRSYENALSSFEGCTLQQTCHSKTLFFFSYFSYYFSKTMFWRNCGLRWWCSPVMSFNIWVAELVQEHVSYFYRQENTFHPYRLEAFPTTLQELTFQSLQCQYTVFLLETFPVYVLREFEFQTGINELPRYKDRQKKRPSTNFSNSSLQHLRSNGRDVGF